tara:strand:- start:817 stop:1026 length:210 start_codon:yes stop_codon:yes gene_type:complete
MSELVKVLLSSYGFAILLWIVFIYTQNKFGKLEKKVSAKRLNIKYFIIIVLGYGTFSLVLISVYSDWFK